MLVISTGEVHMLGLIALRLRKAALGLLVADECNVPKTVTSAIMLFAEAYKLNPEMAIYDPQLGAEMGCSYAFRRLNGDTIAIVREGADTEALIRQYDQDDVLRGEWVYSSVDTALRAVHDWRIATEDAPPPEEVGRRREARQLLPLTQKRTTS